MPPGRIFISYRRDDAAGYARAVYDELERHFTDERVFMDVDDIAAGQPFDEVIRREVGAARVLLVLIGPRRAGGPPSRLDDPADYVRLEIEAGLAAGLQVVPVLIDGARMPAESTLPPSLRPLARRQALELSNTSYAHDMQRLVATLRQATGHPPAEPAATTLRWKGLLVGTAAAGLAAGLLVGAFYFFGPGRERPAVNGEWVAEVRYDWPNANFSERFVFAGEGEALHGSASFLRGPRGIVAGSVVPEGIRFETRTEETLGTVTREVTHRYRGTLAGGEIRFVMQTEGGSSAHVPIEFTARRTTP